MASLVRTTAPAKVNLALSVGACLSSGMHPIASCMTTVRLEDDLEVKRLAHDRMSRFAIEWHPDARRQTEINWPIRKDLAVRAHTLLEEKLSRSLPIQLRLQKRIPVGSGLGGGSSNAAAMLRALDALFELRLRSEYLESIALELGSDVPFLVRGGCAIVEGTGGALEAATQHETHLVFVLPEVQCPTAEVYRAFDALRSDARVDPARVRMLAALPVAPHAPFNDLADAALAVAPALAELRTRVAQISELPVHVSGSGSTLFVVCDSAVHADALAAAIEMRLHVPSIATVTAPTRAIEVDDEEPSTTLPY